MAISIDYSTNIIFVPQADLTPLGGSLYELDVDAFRLELKSLEAAADGIAFPDTHRHVTETTLSGVTYARIVEILSPYTVEFEDGQYTVQTVGANHNIADVKVANQVSLVTQNSAGLIKVSTGVGTPAEVSDAVWQTPIAGMDPGSVGEALFLTLVSRGLHPTMEVEHGKTYIRAPADGSVLNLQVTKSGDTVTVKRL